MLGVSLQGGSKTGMARKERVARFFVEFPGLNHYKQSRWPMNSNSSVSSLPVTTRKRTNARVESCENSKSRFEINPEIPSETERNQSNFSASGKALL